MPFKSPGLVLALAATLVALVLVSGSMSAIGESADESLATALAYVDGNAADLGVTRADVADLFVTSQYTSAHSGVTHVNLNQRYKGLEVFGGNVTVNVNAAGQVIFASGSLVADLAAASGVADLEATEAVEVAAEELDLGEPAELEVSPAKLGWQPTADGLRLAWQLVLDASSDSSLWNAAVDAETGELLNADDWTSEHSLGELTSTLGGLSASPTSPAGTTNPVIDGSSYRVYEIPTESPNDRDRALVENPADALASPFGWHDTNGVIGPEFTITRGNNVHAYLDRDANNQPDLPEVDGGPSLTFDFPLDLGQQPQTYGDAATTNLFYWCNVAHDLFYLYGFTEPTGNFQQNNYGRGGVGTDYVRCEAQDGAGTNNANFSTPAADGGVPRMQMFLWNTNAELPNLVTVDAPSPSAGVYQATGAAFGPAPTAAGVTGQIVIVNAGPNPDFPGAPANEGCGPLIGFPAGAIALVDRGTCPFVQKAVTAQAAGAAAVIVANNVADPPITMGGADPTVVIPSVMVSLANGNVLKAGLPASGKVSANPNSLLRDGDLDAGIVFHEYGHGLSLRLTGGPGINCLGGTEQMGEGWSDYVALAALIDPALDDPESSRGLVPYVLRQPDRSGAGLRPRPYSRTFTIQPATYDSIKTNAWLAGANLAAPHGVGHVWAAFLWEMTWDLIDKHGYHPNIYDPWSSGGNNRSYQYVIDGLKTQGCNPTFVISRNAILAAANTLGGGAAGEQAGDSCTIWGAFARRGVGFSAIGGGTSRDDGTEAFDTHPNCREDFASPSLQPYGQLNQADPGKAVKFKVDLGANLGESQLASPQYPFSRRVNCSNLTVPSQGAAVTPREYPLLASSSDGLGLKYKQNEGTYQFNWQTQEDWLGTCREFVLQVKDGTQFRAFFQFLYPFEGFSGTVKGPVTDVSSKNVFTLWWKLGGDRGLDIFASEPQSRPVDCTTFLPTGPYEPTATTTGLGYQASTARYFYPWVPDPSWLGTCREFTISLNDGTSHSTFVRYVK